MNKRTFLTLLMVVAVALMAFAPLQAQDDAVLNVAWPYTVPPTGHFNTFATNGLVFGQY
jgi:hypothetical protein